MRNSESLSIEELKRRGLLYRRIQLNVLDKRVTREIMPLVMCALPDEGMTTFRTDKGEVCVEKQPYKKSEVFDIWIEGRDGH